MTDKNKDRRRPIPAAVLRVEGLAEIEAHLLADDFASPLARDEDEAEDESDCAAEEDFAADCDSERPRTLRNCNVDGKARRD